MFARSDFLIWCGGRCRARLATASKSLFHRTQWLRQMNWEGMLVRSLTGMERLSRSQSWRSDQGIECCLADLNGLLSCLRRWVSFRLLVPVHEVSGLFWVDSWLCWCGLSHYDSFYLPSIWWKRKFHRYLGCRSWSRETVCLGWRILPDSHPFHHVD